MSNIKQIDKSAFTAEELETYEALIAKAAVDPAAAGEEMKDEKPAEPAKNKPTEKEEVPEMEKTEKSASPELTEALEQLADLKKSFEMNEMIQVAKKYAPLGKKEDELAQTLYEMKKSNSANYDAYISVLDESLALVEKSGVFAEIGKSTSNGTAGGAVSKAEAKAAEIMKADPNVDYTTAIAKAWEDPSIMAAYDAERAGM